VNHALAALAAGMVLVFVAAPSGCVAGAPERHERPRAPLPEIRPAPPAPGMIWVPGAWHYNGVEEVWVPGRWESPPPLPVVQEAAASSG
jgi:hypothetical protein